MRDREVRNPTTTPQEGAVPLPDKSGRNEVRALFLFLPSFAGEGDRQARLRAQGVVGYLTFFRTIALVFLASLQLAAAIAPHEAMGNADQERRARALYAEVRCVVCQNESIADSGADIAADLRSDIRTQITAGHTDTQIREALVERYGDYVLFRPRLTAANLILWASPFVVLMLGGVAFWSLTRRKKTVPEAVAPADLDEDEAERLRERLSGSPLISGGKPPSSAEGG